MFNIERREFQAKTSKINITDECRYRSTSKRTKQVVVTCVPKSSNSRKCLISFVWRKSPNFVIIGDWDSNKKKCWRNFQT